MSDDAREDLSPALAELLSGSCYCLAVRRASRRMIRLYDAALGELGLSISQLGTLAWIKALRVPTVQKIADYMEMDQSAMSRGLVPLERSGYVMGAPHPEDKRRRVLALTESGEAALAQGAEAWAEAQREVEAEQAEGGNLAALMTSLNGLATYDRT
ncbi:MarR family winged helix-turn-helix transcriptional regulator [Maritimibacter dapengensis]|uniref:MarR family winged helix-turn-helix transcriptional regulator n=1 Tax=Maritimibacter dapengensis TaxID=2836868 RepID=A0ABS6T0B4_9RHOB|nr:MarR family winged helix-turn-helix transcriptional regulator [Maritimibacter dapengensis]MBV7377822.1 MarR family winged helix-turn-helix transcriptional regulator [Maritimibacter dapengensis]